MADSIITYRQEPTSGGAVPEGTISIHQNIVTDTTTIENPLGQVVTNYSYIPFMREIDIDFVGYGLRPYRKIYYYFDNNLVNGFVQRPNVIETDSETLIHDIKTGLREYIKVGAGASAPTARIIHTERNESTGKQRLYVSEFANAATIAVDSTVTSMNGSFTAAVTKYEHNSGRTSSWDVFGFDIARIKLSPDANTTINDYYMGNTFTIVTGPLAGHTSEIVGYDASTQIANVSPALSLDANNQIYSIGDPRTGYSSNNNQSIYVTPRGFASGILHIPNPNYDILKIPTGDRIFRILDNPRNDTQQYTTRAEYRFVSNGTDLHKAQVIERTTEVTIQNYIDVVLPPTPTPTRSVTPTPTRTVTVTPTQSISISPTPTHSVTATVTPTSSTSVTPPVSPTPTKTATVSPTPSPTKSLTPSRTPEPSNKCKPYEDGHDNGFHCGWQKDTWTYQGGAADWADRGGWPWQHVKRFRYVTKDNQVIKEAPNRFVDGEWRIGSIAGNLITTDEDNLLPTGIKFGTTGIYADKEKYISYLGWDQLWHGPYYVPGLYAHGILCHRLAGTNCVGVPHDPIAQTFYVDAALHKNGIFVTSVDLYFKNKGGLPVELQIRTVENGYPSSNTIIPGAVCVLQNEDVKTSEFPNTANSQTATTFKFSSPVYLNSGFDYSLVVISDDYEYDIYVAEKGKTVLGSDRLLSEQPYLGSLFKSQNQRTWTAFQDEDLMFQINQAQFSTEKASIIFREDKDRQKKVTTDKLYYDSFEYHSDAIELPSTKIEYSTKSMSNTTFTQDDAYLTIRPERRIDLSERKVLMPSSNTDYTFEARLDLSTTDQDVSPAVFQNRQNLVVIENLINDSTLTADKFIIANTGNGYTGNCEMVITSVSGSGANAYAEVINGNIASIVVRSVGSGYVDDAYVTLQNTATTFNGNVIIVTETGQSGGPALARYISKTVTLLDGFDAGDLRVFLSAVKPASSNVQVYYKVRNSLDGNPIESRNWVRMVQKTSPYIFSTNGEQIEYEFRPSLTSNNIVYSTNDATYRTFNQYAIKIVLTSTGTAASQIPYVYDVRATALPADAY